MSNIVYPVELTGPGNGGIYIPVLDKGYVWTDFDRMSMGTDLMPIEAARMSTGNPTGVNEKGDDATRSFLYRHQHMTPFEMAVLQLEMQTPIFVAREIIRHRTFSFNEFSGRYAEMPNLYYVPTADEIRLQHPTNKQMSGDIADLLLAERIIQEIEEAVAGIRAKYDGFLHDDGLAKEIARIILPLNQYTRFRMQGVLRNWFQFLKLRLPGDVQPQTQAYARAVEQLIEQRWPLCHGEFVENDRDAIKYPKTEQNLILTVLDEFPLAKERLKELSMDAFGHNNRRHNEFMSHLQIA